ncbi:aldehyde dehydrogenase [Sphingomonas oryzagri]
MTESAIIEGLRMPGDAIIDGDAVIVAARFDNVTPRDGRVIGKVALCSPADVDRAVASARAAFENGRWRDLAYNDKKKVLFRLADLIEAHLDELATLESLDMGKPVADARAFDIPASAKTFRYYAEALDKLYGEVGPHHPGRISWVQHEPLGVIGCIVPWNFPLNMAAWKVAPALAMGNSVVLKPAEQSPLTAIRLGELALEAGLPPGVLNVVPGTGEITGQALAKHNDVDMIAFTGSGSVGGLLMRYAGESNLKRVSLELGGKSPQIVFADCPDMEAAAQAAAWAIFFNQGEVCTAGSRLLVQNSIKAEFIERVVAVAKTIVPGDPLDPATRFGAMVSEEQMTGVLRRIERAKADGAKLLLGGHRVREESGGFYITPTIFDRVDPSSALATEEVFGPVLGVIGFDTPDEAFKLANSTIYGLAAGVWTADVNLAHRAARRIRSGLVWINGWDACDITMPFGGFRQSGFGRDRSMHALEKYADLKAVTISFTGGQ